MTRNSAEQPSQSEKILTTGAMTLKTTMDTTTDHTVPYILLTGTGTIHPGDTMTRGITAATTVRGTMTRGIMEAGMTLGIMIRGIMADITVRGITIITTTAAGTILIGITTDRDTVRAMLLTGRMKTDGTAQGRYPQLQTRFPEHLQATAEESAQAVQ